MFELSIYRPNLSSDQHLSITIGAGLSTMTLHKDILLKVVLTFVELLSD